MKYSRLTREQFQEMHQEFINFLSSQTITAKEWEEIKTNKPEVAEQELDVFSDLIWEGALTKATYLENISANQIYLFHMDTDKMHLIVIKINSPEIDFLTAEGIQWLQQNITEDNVEIFKASKGYSEDKNADKFELVKQGAEITKGHLYKSLKPFLS